MSTFNNVVWHFYGSQNCVKYKVIREKISEIQELILYTCVINTFKKVHVLPEYSSCAVDNCDIKIESFYEWRLRRLVSVRDVFWNCECSSEINVNTYKTYIHKNTFTLNLELKLRVIYFIRAKDHGPSQKGLSIVSGECDTMPHPPLTINR